MLFIKLIVSENSSKERIDKGLEKMLAEKGGKRPNVKMGEREGGVWLTIRR